jgi:hypothetical protein
MSEAKQSQSRVVFEIKMNILIEKSDEALIKTKIQKTQNSSRMSRFIRDGAIQLKAKFAKQI